MKHISTVLIVDDDPDIRNLISIYLKNEGYHLLQAENGEKAWELIQKESVQCIILDMMMPKMDGVQFLMKLRQESMIPVIYVTAKSEDMDKITGLSLGADDYVTKPFNPLELVARVKTNIRRYTHSTPIVQQAESYIEIGHLSINTDRHQVFIDQEEIVLTRREFDILALLAKNRSIVFSTDRIYEAVWKEEAISSQNTVMVHIRKIREKIAAVTPTKYIETVWGVGYKIEKE
ncbi:response regulator transcription factor [Priestia taiwanensis]|uniref:DNA-binding response regulator n=1 Tax=Priestia taiwanensis TaxID=1347902 RepID=A0A917EM32_9BACI|nr:response regulator transcription factor [Priestia taiwanensis]MBM7362208.1 DNA-binding response OmpR family regulator [Priestia taiwanensis]GGE60270.1 DNA-binding response regulator [Priestia taiwanensis]